MKTFREFGAFGALIDEYEKSIIELQEVIKNISSEELTTIVDTETKDPDCRSIQTILTHVVRASYGYVVIIRKSIGEEVEYKDGILLQSSIAYQQALNEMLQYNIQLLEDHPNLQLEAFDYDKKFKVRWGQLYDVEQLLEHAIVHILRHRRQIEKFLIQLRK